MPKSSNALRGRVRIIGGVWKKSVLHFPDIEGLRPTPDRVRETLFNWLGQDLSGLQCLDLYAGSGALGFEAASRGASRVVLVERDAEAVRAMRENATRLSATELEIRSGDVLAWLILRKRTVRCGFPRPPVQAECAPRRARAPAGRPESRFARLCGSAGTARRRTRLARTQAQPGRSCQLPIAGVER